MRLVPSCNALRTSSDSARRAWSRSNEAMVCMLFLTRWWISWIMATLTRSSSSWRRASVASWMVISTPSNRQEEPTPGKSLRTRLPEE